MPALTARALRGVIAVSCAAAAAAAAAAAVNVCDCGGPTASCCLISSPRTLSDDTTFEAAATALSFVGGGSLNCTRDDGSLCSITLTVANFTASDAGPPCSCASHAPAAATSPSTSWGGTIITADALTIQSGGPVIFAFIQPASSPTYAVHRLDIAAPSSSVAWFPAAADGPGGSIGGIYVRAGSFDARCQLRSSVGAVDVDVQNGFSLAPCHGSGIFADSIAAMGYASIVSGAGAVALVVPSIVVVPPVNISMATPTTAILLQATAVALTFRGDSPALQAGFITIAASAGNVTINPGYTPAALIDATGGAHAAGTGNAPGAVCGAGKGSGAGHGGSGGNVSIGTYLCRGAGSYDMGFIDDPCDPSPSQPGSGGPRGDGVFGGSGGGFVALQAPTSMPSAGVFINSQLTISVDATPSSGSGGTGGGSGGAVSITGGTVAVTQALAITARGGAGGAPGRAGGGGGVIAVRASQRAWDAGAITADVSGGAGDGGEAGAGAPGIADLQLAVCKEAASIRQ